VLRQLAATRMKCCLSFAAMFLLAAIAVASVSAAESVDGLVPEMEESRQVQPLAHDESEAELIGAGVSMEVKESQIAAVRKQIADMNKSINGIRPLTSDHAEDVADMEAKAAEYEHEQNAKAKARSDLSDKIASKIPKTCVKWCAATVGGPVVCCGFAGEEEESLIETGAAMSPQQQKKTIQQIKKRFAAVNWPKQNAAGSASAATQQKADEKVVEIKESQIAAVRKQIADMNKAINGISPLTSDHAEDVADMKAKAAEYEHEQKAKAKARSDLSDKIASTIPQGTCLQWCAMTPGAPPYCCKFYE